MVKLNEGGQNEKKNAHPTDPKLVGRTIELVEHVPNKEMRNCASVDVLRVLWVTAQQLATLQC